MERVIRVNQPYRVSNTMVQGDGVSYTLNNKFDAEQLCKQLNNYETTIQNTKNTNNTINKLEKQVTQLKLTINLLDEEIQQMKELQK